VYCHFAEARTDLIDGESDLPTTSGLRETRPRSAA
jgi:hypothetical protein